MISAVSGLAVSAQATSVESLAKCYGVYEGIRTNHVISKTGSFVDQAGSSRGLSTKEDLALMLELRKLADCVIVDAATARQEKYQKIPGTHLAIVSLSGDFTSIPAATSSNSVTLFSPGLSADYSLSGPEHVVISPANPFEQIMLWSEILGLKSLLLEAGPTLTRIAFEANCVSQSAITVTPRVTSDDSHSGLNPFSSAGELLSVANSIDASFMLWSY
jgi:hypothetical protein